jgi:hypothetical protein
MKTQIKVQTFNLNDLADKSIYEDILNRYEKIKEEFAYMKDGTPLVTIWYAEEEDG